MNDIVSVVLTCYFEGELLRQSVPVLRATLQQSGLEHDIIVVVDGADEATDRALRLLEVEAPDVRIFRNATNVGRGGSVARGSREARGDIVGFVDPDLEIHPTVIPVMVDKIRGGCDLAVARRDVPLKATNGFRWICSKGYKAVANLALQLPDIDTESGCKFYRRDVLAPVIDSVENQRWFWDTELVTRALYAKLRVCQVPVGYTRNFDHPTTVRVFHDTLEYLRELIRLRRQLRRASTRRRAPR